MLMRLASKNYQNRKVALIENGSWAPMAAKLMRAKLEMMKAIEIVEPTITIRSAMSEKNREEITQMAEVLR
jgi:flavorubredoxin